MQSLVLPDTSESAGARTARAEEAETKESRGSCDVVSCPISVLSVWRDALSVFSEHSAAILFCALIGFAAPPILGKWLDTHARLSDYARTQSVVVLYDKPSLFILLTQAIVGVFALTFARGAITYMALHHNQPCEDGKPRDSFGEAIGMTFARYPALLVSALVYGAIIAMFIQGTSLMTQRLEFDPSKLKSAHIWAGPTRALSDVVHQLVWRGLNALIPNPGSPFTEFTPDLRRFTLNHWTSVTIFSIYPTASGSSETRLGSDLEYIRLYSTQLPSGWLAACSGILIILTESLLRFRTVMVMKPPRSSHFSETESGRERPRQFVAIAPLIASASFGLRHFGAITLHIWFVRLAIFALSVAFVEFPLAMVDNLLVPYARPGGSFEILPIMGFLETTGAALVSAILLAFSVVYDARLAMRLDPRITHN